MTEYKKIVEEQAQKIQEENNNNALIALAGRESQREVRMLFAFKNYKDRSEYEFSDKRKKAITEWEVTDPTTEQHDYKGLFWMMSQNNYIDGVNCKL
jgi:hypothetical protein